MAQTPVTPKDPKVGYYVAGVQGSGELIVQPFPKTGCCDGSSSTTATGVYLPLAGGTMTGTIVLHGDPAASLDAATKRYVDQKIAAIGSGSGSGGTGGTGGTGTTPVIPPGGELPIVDIGPVTPGDACPVDGGAKWDDTTGQLYICSNGKWETVQDALTPNTPAPVPIGPTPPSNPAEGDTWYNTNDDFLYIYRNGSWQSIYAPSAPGQIGGAVLVVAALPSLPDGKYPVGTVAFCTADSKLYENVGEKWVNITQALTPNAPDAVQIVSTKPALPDAKYPSGSVIFARDDNQLYKSDGSTWTLITQQASIAAGSITAGMIQAGAIGTQQLAAGAITADKMAAGVITAASIGAGTITSDKLAANSVTAGKVAAGAIGASQIQAGVITTDKLASNFLIAGNAQIAVGSITHLQIAGSSLIVPAGAINQGYIGSGTLVSVTITLPTRMGVIISYTGNADKVSTSASVGVLLQVDGSTKIGFPAYSQTTAIGYYTVLNAGSHTFSAVVSGSGVQHGNNVIYVMGAKV